MDDESLKMLGSAGDYELWVRATDGQYFISQPSIICILDTPDQSASIAVLRRMAIQDQRSRCKASHV